MCIYFIFLWNYSCNDIQLFSYKEITVSFQFNLKKGRKHRVRYYTPLGEFPRAMYRKYRKMAFSQVFEFVNSLNIGSG
jgi:hypothetical protein